MILFYFRSGDGQTTLPSIPIKRTVSSRAEERVLDSIQASSTTGMVTETDSEPEEPSIKRIKKNARAAYTMDLDDQEAADMAINNPMSRKNRRKGAKMERMHSMRRTIGVNESMVVDSEGLHINGAFTSQHGTNIAAM